MSYASAAFPVRQTTSRKQRSKFKDILQNILKVDDAMFNEAPLGILKGVPMFIIIIIITIIIRMSMQAQHCFEKRNNL